VTADLLMIVPSRGRPENVRALLEAWAETATGAADIVVALDADDPEWSSYKRLGWSVTGWPWGGVLPMRYTMPERQRLGATLNHVTLRMIWHWSDPHPYRMVGFMGDDHRPRTKGWDRLMVDALDDMGTGLVYGNDLFQQSNLPTQWAMTSDIVRGLGYMVPGGLVHLYIDNALKELTERAGCLRYLPDVVIEHLHPSAGKAELDDSYRETNSEAQFEADKHRFEDWQRFGLDADVARLQELIRRG
jgi:hypothetical protein